MIVKINREKYMIAYITSTHIKPFNNLELSFLAIRCSLIAVWKNKNERRKAGGEFVKIKRPVTVRVKRFEELFDGALARA